MRLFLSACLAAIAICATPPRPVWGADKPPSALAFSFPIQRYTLANGLRVVLSPDAASSRISVVVTYAVGSRHEEPGRTGFAHFFEHMMFQGSANVEKGGHARLLVGRGGNLGGGTGSDLTNYYATGPAKELPLMLWLEADRMRALDLTEENFENQRLVVREEVQGGADQTYVAGWRRLEEMVFQGYWPYAHPTGGLIKDINSAQFPWVKAFHHQYYQPNNAVVSIFGGFDPTEARALIERYFGKIPAGEAPKYVDPPMPEQKEQRRETMVDPRAQTPAVVYGFAGPRWMTKEHHALKLASIVLGNGDGSRLRRRLMKKDKPLARTTQASWDVINYGPHLLTVDAELAEGTPIADVRRIIEEEMDRLGKEPLSAVELQGARRTAQLEQVSWVQGLLGQAIFIGAFEVLFGDAQLINKELQRYEEITAEDVRNAAAKYLAPTRRCIMEIMPKVEVKP